MARIWYETRGAYNKNKVSVRTFLYEFVDDSHELVTPWYFLCSKGNDQFEGLWNDGYRRGEVAGSS